MTKQLVVLGTAVMTTLPALVALWQFRIVVIYFLISLALAATVRPIVISKSGRSAVTRLLWIVLYLVSLGIFGLLIMLVGRLLVANIQDLVQQISIQKTWMLPPWLDDSFIKQALDR